MSVKIRLMRIGAKGRPFYRVVAVDERRKRTGGYLELLGTYNPLTTPHELLLKQDLIDAWIKKGAVLSEGYLRIIKQAPQHVARKPKKDRSKQAKVAPAEATVSEPSDAEATLDREATVDTETNVETPTEEVAAETTDETPSPSAKASGDTEVNETETVAEATADNETEPEPVTETPEATTETEPASSEAPETEGK